MARSTQKQKMKIIGLTGGIGMGKSTAAKILRSMRLPVYHADRAVHDLLKKGGRAVRPIGLLFPDVIKGGAVDRKALGAIVFGNPRKLKKLEAILHPLVWEAERSFLKKANQLRAPAAVLEIPLLFETGGEKRCDAVLVVTAPAAVQKARVMARPGMTALKYRAILKRQMPDKIKRSHADYVISTDKSLTDTRQQLKQVMESIID